MGQCQMEQMKYKKNGQRTCKMQVFQFFFERDRNYFEGRKPFSGMEKYPKGRKVVWQGIKATGVLEKHLAG